jgi:hypothetical protein
MLQENRETEKEICVLFATHGCPKQFHIVKKKYTTNQNQKAKGYAFKDFILDWLRK